MKKFIKEKWDMLSKERKIVLIIVFALFAMSPFIDNRQNANSHNDKQIKQEQQAKHKEEKPQKTPEQIEQEKRDNWIGRQFKPWDGSHVILSRVIKSRLNDEDSFKAVETKYWDKGDHLVIKEMFTCKNGFGATMKHVATAKQDIYSDAVEIVEIQ